MEHIVVNTLFALIMAFGLSALQGPLVIPMLRRLKFGQNVRDDGPQTHLVKQGTPTMGGIMILLSLVVTALLWGRADYTFTLIALCMSILFGCLGFMDDFIKVVKKRSLGLKAWQKIAGQFLLALGFSFWLYFTDGVGSTLFLDRMDLGVFYIPFAMFVIIAIVNSVNLIDGLDGLSSSVTGTYSIFTAALLVMFVLTTNDMDVATAARMNAMAAFSAALAGACLGFLVHNAYPAKVFMGDAGAFTLGGAIAAVALLTRTTLLVPLMGICYVMTSVSVILQVGSYKLRNKKRIFKMAPLHHHFEQGGVPETRIVSMYQIVTLIASAAALILFWFVK